MVLGLTRGKSTPLKSRMILTMCSYSFKIQHVQTVSGRSSGGILLVLEIFFEGLHHYWAMTFLFGSSILLLSHIHVVARMYLYTAIINYWYLWQANIIQRRQWRQVKKLCRKRKRLEIKLQKVTHASHKKLLREPVTYRKDLKVSKSLF